MRKRIADGGRVSLDVSAVDKKQRRAECEQTLAAAQQALPDKRNGVIYVDPEWRFDVYSRNTGMDRSADNHYPTSSTNDICAGPVADITAVNCVLFQWTTVPKLPDAYVISEWGFEYKSYCIWAKDRIGPDYCLRNQRELFLQAREGAFRPRSALK